MKVLQPYISSKQSETIAKIYHNEIIKAEEEMHQFEVEQNLQCQCCAGCDKCCHDLILINAFEGNIIANEVKKMRSYQREPIYRQLEEQEEILNDNGIYLKDVKRLVLMGGREKLLELKEKYYKINLPCIFLKDHKCSIYNVRPTDCWTYRQYYSSEKCETGPSREGAYVFKDKEFSVINKVIRTIYPKTDRIESLYGPLPLVLKEWLNPNKQ